MLYNYNMIVRNTKKQIYVLLLIVFFGFYLFSQNVIDNEVGMGLKPIPTQVCVKNKCFKVKTAVTAQEQKIGLMNREHLALDNGMLFIFERENIYDFWMKDTLISLDIIWIDKNNKIIFIKENAKPCRVEPYKSFGPNKKALYVLEINKGLARKMGLEIGNVVEFRK